MTINTSGLDAILKKYTEELQGDQGLRGAAYIVKDKNGDTLYSNAMGKLTSQPDSAPYTQDSVGWAASMSKLVTSVAAMQVVEKGLIGLDDDTGKHLPHLANVKVFKGLDDNGTPILEKREKPITLRHLLTHTSGFCYTSLGVELGTWCEAIGRTPSDNHVMSDMTVPLVFEPGSSWTYGRSIDWAGFVVEAVSGVTLEEYMKRNIFEPLGMSSTTFFIKSRPELKPRRSELEWKEEPDLPFKHPGPDDRDNPEICAGGSGLFSTGNDYAKLLGALVSGDSRILSEKSLKALFTPQLDDRHIPALTGFCTLMGPISPVPDISLGNHDPPIPFNHGLGGCLNMEDVPGHRRKGSITWKGITNGYWWIDPETGIAATIFLHVLPFGASASNNLAIDLETETYKLWGQK